MTAPKGPYGGPPHASFQNVMLVVSQKPLAALVAPGVFDVVVSSDDSDLSMGGGVSAELARLGGPDYVAPARALAPLKLGDVVASPPGNLHCRHVLQAVTIDRSHMLFPTERTLRQLAREALARCESLEAQSVLVPLVGAGAGGFPAIESAVLLVDALLEHLKNRSVLQHVVLSVPGPDVFEACRERLPAMIQRFRGRSRVELRFPGSTSFRSQDPAPDTQRLPSAVLGATPPAPGAAFPAPGAAPPAAGAAPPPQPANPPAPRSPIRISYSAEAETAQDSPSRSPTSPISSPSEMPGPSASKSADSHRPVLARRYVLLEELGRGGFGVVHLSWDLVLRRVVAIKQLRTDRALSELLRREAAIALELTHECIVRTHHFEPETDDAPAFIVMEYVPWPTAERWLANSGNQMPPPRVVAELGMRVCDGLAYAHSHQALHLDLKPANLFVDVDAERVKLADFGLARISSSAGRVLPEEPRGTPGYMAPEQSMPGARVTPATDCYQLAATLWDLLVGRAPGPSAEPPAQADAERRRFLDVLRPALAPQPQVRPESASAFRRLLASAL